MSKNSADPAQPPSKSAFPSSHECQIEMDEWRRAEGDWEFVRTIRGTTQQRPYSRSSSARWRNSHSPNMYVVSLAKLSGSVAVIQHPAQTLPPLDLAFAFGGKCIGSDQPVPEALTIALQMIVRQEFTDLRLRQRGSSVPNRTL